MPRRPSSLDVSKVTCREQTECICCEKHSTSLHKACNYTNMNDQSSKVNVEHDAHQIKGTLVIKRSGRSDRRAA